MDINEEKMLIFDKDLTSLTKEQLETPHHRSIVALTFFNNRKQKLVGSGVLISPNLIFTAAHNIYDKAQKFQHVDVKVHLSVDGFAQEKKSYDVEWKYPPEYKTCSPSKKIELDYALLKLKEPINFGEYLPLGLPCELCLMERNKQTALQIFGYPGGYKDNYQPFGKYKEKFILNQYGLAERDRILLVQPEHFLIRYAISTLQGQSGTPVCANNEIIAIHTGSGRKEEEEFNVGRLVTVDLIDNLEKWSKQQELNGVPFSVIPKRDCPHMKENKEASGSVLLEERQLIGDGERMKQREQIPQQISENLEKTKMEEQLDFIQKALKVIDVTKYTKLKKLFLNKNKLTTIDLRNNLQLTQLWLYENQIKAIDLSNNTNLVHLQLYNNQLSRVDLSNNQELAKLDLSSNQLSEVDLSNNPKLIQLFLGDNKLNAVTCWYSDELQLHFDNQHSASCLITLLFRQGEAEKCKQFGRNKVKQYNDNNGYGQSNKYNCSYSFRTMERS